MGKHPGGRPLKFQKAEELQERIDAYFADCDPHMEEVSEWVEAREKDGKLKKDEHGLNYLVEVKHKVMTKQIPYTITGLALFLDTSRQTLLEYEGEVEGRDDKDPKFADTLKAAKEKCESFAEELLYTAPNVTGPIFNLKNNYGWRDKTEADITSDGERIGLSDEQIEQLIRARTKRSDT